VSVDEQAERSSATGRLVLVVEDEERIAEVLEAYLRRDGFRTARAGDGPSAVAAHAQLRPDLVLLDVLLPGYDGFEVLRRLTALAPSGHHGHGRAEEVEHAGRRGWERRLRREAYSPAEVVARCTRAATDRG
jgi:CheY-like chemotaxis protein